MSTIDLEGYLVDSEHSVQNQLMRWLSLEHGRVGQSRRPESFLGPWIIQVTFKSPGESFQDLFSDALKSCDPSQTGNVVDAIRQQFLATVGPSPEGVVVRTRCYRSGCSSSPGVHCKRTISTHFGPSISSNVAQLEQHNARLMTSMSGLIGDIKAILVSQGTVIAEMAQSQATLATARSAGTTTAEVAGGGLNGLIALVSIVVLWPMIRESVNLPDGVTLPDMLRLFQHRVQGAIGGDHLDQISPPPPIPSAAEAVDSPADGAQSLDHTLDAIKTQPELLDSLVSRVLSDPELKQALLAAYMKAK